MMIPPGRYQELASGLCRKCISNPLYLLALLAIPFSISALSASSPREPVSQRSSSPHPNTQLNTHSLQKPKTSSFELLPVPTSTSDNSQSSLIQQQRNIFATPGAAMPSSPLPAGLKLTGFLKVGGSVSALLATGAGEQAYAIGDQVGNGYRLINVSAKLNSVLVSNGSARHVLVLPR